MEKQLQLVTSEQAKRLKEAGFDWKTLVSYTYNGDLTDVGDVIHKNTLFHYVCAPSVALALKWFRDVKGVRCCVSIDVPDEWIGEYYDDKRCEFTGSYEMYEAAESALLDELLTSIEKAKTIK
ncbi:MAG: hypothetical protein LBH91_03145 [Prevotellaceae bacterium]|jgi:hypothetical protein|nr:hypothetical protein [Prevotellaceae bacterium]